MQRAVLAGSTSSFFRMRLSEQITGTRGDAATDAANLNGAHPPASGHRAADACKICGSRDLRVEFHTARCRDCGVLLFYPYPDEPAPPSASERDAVRSEYDAWYAETAWRNHGNFTAMLRYALGDREPMEALRVLDYGGGGGQFAVVVKSHFPNAQVWLTDLADDAVLPQWKPLNHVIPFQVFEDDGTTFDAIFLNDVYEHVSNPEAVLRLMTSKLAPGGRIFIDTPRIFWLYDFLRVAAPPVYKKLCEGTVTHAHLQIWSERAFRNVAYRCGLFIARYRTLTEFTQGSTYYLRKMRIDSWLMLALGRLFYVFAPVIANNKIMAVLERGAPPAGGH